MGNGNDNLKGHKRNSHQAWWNGGGGGGVEWPRSAETSNILKGEKGSSDAECRAEEVLVLWSQRVGVRRTTTKTSYEKAGWVRGGRAGSDENVNGKNNQRSTVTLHHSRQRVEHGGLWGGGEVHKKGQHWQ